MSKYSTSVKVIALGLAIIYALSFLIYFNYSFVPDLMLSTAVLVVLFTVLLVGAVGAFLFKEWGRKILVMGNLVMFLYLFGLDVFQPNVIPPSYMVMSLIAVLFFSQGKTKILYIEEGNSPRKSILVVDDDHTLLRTIKSVLLSNGYSVLTTTTGEKGLQVAKRQKPDLIVLDVILPGIKGRQVCAKLKEDTETQHIPVIFLTAKDSPDDVKAELAVGGISHITKPLNSQKLLEEIRKILGS